MSEQLVFSLDRLLRWIIKVFWLHVLIIGFSILGLFIAGLFPAIVAALSVSKKWLDQEEFSIAKEFRKVYFQEFFKANLLGWVFALIGFVLYINYTVMVQMGDQLSVIVVFAYYFVIFVYMTVLAWAFPLYVHTKERLGTLIKNAFIMGVTFLPRTIGIFVGVFIILYISLSIPTMLLFFTGSLLALYIMFITHRVFEKIAIQNRVSVED